MTQEQSAEELFATLSERVGQAMLTAWNDQVRPFHMLDDRQKAVVLAMGGVGAIVSALVAAEFAPEQAVGMVTAFAGSVAEDVSGSIGLAA